MIVYSASKKEFIEDVHSNEIHKKILDEFKFKLNRGVGEREVQSWRNSMQFVSNVLNDEEIPADSGVAIEYSIPLTAKRVDFILTGKDHNRRDTAVIIELKQWSDVKKTDKDGVVRTYLGHGERETSHPSYQAWTYAALIEDYNSAVQEQGISLQPCAFLHNLDFDDVINDPFYAEHTEKAPVFISTDVEKLSKFLKQFVKYGDSNDIMYRIENGKIKPSKNLAEYLASMLKGNSEFVMIDDQKLVYETAIALAHQANPDNKQVLIVEGGPGTGKSVVAVNLLVEFTKRDLVAQYVTKNAAPRAVYSAHLKNSMTKNRIDNLFKGSGSFTNIEPNTFDVLVIDEAHRLIEKNRYIKNSENQIKELIRASHLAVFFVDEDQTVTWNDIGDKAEIRKWAEVLGASVTEMALESQFRCNGSDGYLAWTDNTLQIRETANAKLGSDEYDFRVFDNPNELKNAIYTKNRINNKARMVAGYCWDWISQTGKKNGDPNGMDITFPEYEFAAQWNLSKHSFEWIIQPDSVKEVGCIHTCQGLEVDFIGVIIGPDLIVRDGQVITDAGARSKMDSSIRGFKKLLKEDESAALAKADRIIKNTYRTLLTRGQKGCYIYCTDKETGDYFKQALESNAEIPLETKSTRYEGLVHEVVPFVQAKPYDGFVPVYDLAAAAGDFSELQQAAYADWVELPEEFATREGMFVIRVVGESMNKRIPNGSWCLFKANPGGTRNSKIVLVQHRDIEDPDHGGSYTVKRYHSEKGVENDVEVNQQIVLMPESTVFGYQPMTLDQPDEDVKVIGEFIAII
jgi:uncharacterized protein